MPMEFETYDKKSEEIHAAIRNLKQQIDEQYTALHQLRSEYYAGDVEKAKTYKGKWIVFKREYEIGKRRKATYEIESLMCVRGVYYNSDDNQLHLNGKVITRYGSVVTNDTYTTHIDNVNCIEIASDEIVKKFIDTVLDMGV